MLSRFLPRTHTLNAFRVHHYNKINFFATAAKIKVSNPVVDMDGDEMTRVIWDMIKKKTHSPFS